MFDDFAAWLVALVADASRRRLTTFALGTAQDRALRQVAIAALKATASELRPDDEERAAELALVVSQVFSNSGLPGEPGAHSEIARLKHHSEWSGLMR